MKKFLTGPWLYRLLALFFALLLFAYVHTDRINTTRQTSSKSTEMLAQRSKSIKVPLQIDADTDRYYITGYPENVTVELTGPSALVTATSNTQNFRVVANLEKLKIGKHTVKLKQSGINKALTYKIKPSSVTVNIQKRQNRRFPIQVNYNKESLATNYTAGTPDLSSETAVVTGSQAEVDKVDQVVATVPMSRNTKKKVSREVMLQALDKKGNTVNAVLTPQTVHVALPIYLPSKKVSVKLTTKDNGVNGYTYTAESSTTKIRVYGARDVLDKLDSITIPVSVKDIKSKTTKTIKVPVPKDADHTDPQTIKVTIKATDAVATASVSSTN
ncbi:hypothetical protein IV38_GL001888 [Lactobacillus selangorensis]|uniref:YbbR like protein n=1 Tax=Lactobacillus selangorensis TaxID=81857 RepID=A0A0R2FVC6_9LACO|nr:CdaR family protein [Lactobacillus selangorensis]KRN27676.1 hypothetical protein IV38_GL001888 [Lactobacillus selangorensis]KRN30357.1 hypothetical protein IV40_GL001946 [Lactobacillus selangorensis]